MLNKFLTGVAAIVLLAGIAHAAADQAGPPPAPQDQGAGGQSGDQQGWWSRMRGHRHDMQGHMEQRGDQRGPGMRGPGGPGGPGDMMMGKQAFRLQLGPTASVSIMCGGQAMKDCIADAQPLIDAAKAAAGAASTVAVPAK